MHTLIALLSGVGIPAVVLGGLALAELLAALTAPSVLIARRGRPVAALAWLLAMVTLPGLGVVLWWAIGRTHLRRRQRRKLEAHETLQSEIGSLPCTAAPGEPLLPWRNLPEDAASAVLPAVGGNRVELLVDGTATYGELARLVGEAADHVHFLFYSFAPDRVGRRFLELLTERARAGVAVRLLCDAVGSASLKPRDTAALRAAGGHVAVFGRTRLLRRALTVNFRNHRKVVVVDGRSGAVGGLNIGEEYVGDWRDFALSVGGPVVAQLQQVFADDWFFATGESLAHGRYFPPQPCGPAGGAVCSVVAGGPDTRHNLTHDAFLLAVGEARRRVWITTPYLIPSQTVQAALRLAVVRGVDVRLFVPRRSDVTLASLAGRSYYPDLVASGVRVLEYVPATLHGKVWIVDEELVVVGSANLDTRSFRLNFEVSCLVRDAALNAALAGQLERLGRDCEEVTAAALAGAGRLAELRDATANLLSPLL